ncbi:hypothetical protein [Seleniivibrio sp.]|uniref:hypothetical protein n=1 Tax=Seleniivibrio sp. TaxID=2898801 RepID=UPI0025F4EA53|nr:hypothetical protein [Seleniivibrio sp.]MCD8552747.1 hypothetical protein [Seleniivibrio sp.]
MEDFRITMPDMEFGQYNTASFRGVSLSSLHQQNSEMDKTDISSIAERLKFQAEAMLESSVEDSGKPIVNGIDADYINTIIELGKAMPKGDVDIDDLSWGLIVKMGMEMGIEDADVLKELKISDVDTYFYEAVYKEAAINAGMSRFDENGQAVAYNRASDIWKDMFLTDDEGNFLKDENGKPVRNENFVQYRIQTKGAKVTGYSTDAPVWNFKNYEGKLTGLQGGFLQNLLLAVDSEDPYMYRYVREQVTSRMPTWSAETTAKMSESEKTDFYIRQLTYSYKLLKSSMISSMTIKQQLDELKAMYSDGKWEKVKPGGGMTGYLIGSR